MGYGIVTVPGASVTPIKTIPAVPSQSGSLTYNGAAQSPSWYNYDPGVLILGGVTSATNAGTLIATFTPQEGYQWPDGTAAAKNVPWTIGRASIAVPTQKGTLACTGSAQSPTWNGYDSSKMTIGGRASGTDAGTYTATFTPKPNYQWPDGSTSTKNVTWVIGTASLTVPTQKGALTYNGSAQSPAWSGYDSGKMTIGGVTSGTDAGTYTATFALKSGFQWPDGTTSAKNVTWSIGRASLTAPSVSGSRTYNGSAQSPSWSGYDGNKMTLGGTSSATDAGTYSVTVTPKSNYQWADGSTTAKSFSWTINKAAGSLDLNKTSMTLNVSSLTGTIAVRREGDGAISATSSNTGVATVSVSGTTVTVTAKAKGSATITVSVAAGTNHTAPSSKTCAVTVEMPSSTLADNTPADIQAAARAGIAPNYWNVGDKIPIALNGTLGTLTLNGTYYAAILGFNHNASIEGNNSIHFQFGKNSTGRDIAFCDADYGGTSYNNGFVMNTDNIGSGGWEMSYMRKTICPAFLSAMPMAWQNVIAYCTKYNDITGSGTATAASDKIWLLSEFEVYGSQTWASPTEQDYQKQYDYYKNGNSKIRYQHSSPNSACSWWLRSIHAGHQSAFCTVDESIGASSCSPYCSLGFAPGFMVA